jgi:hypothetical protein
MRDYEDEDEEREELEDEEETPNGRTYVHRGCGGATHVSGGDYTHICDPFWPCTSTFCCGCNSFVPLDDVAWANTGEKISKYRSRMRSETPGALKAWRFGVGFLIGGAIGVGVGLLCAVLANMPRQRTTGFLIVGGLVGAFVVYLIGTMILNRVYGIDYRRKR